MPLALTPQGIFRVTSNSRGDGIEAVSNFTIKFVASVDGDKTAHSGGPGFMALIKRIPDEMEKYVINVVQCMRHACMPLCITKKLAIPPYYMAHGPQYMFSGIYTISH